MLVFKLNVMAEQMSGSNFVARNQIVMCHIFYWHFYFYFLFSVAWISFPRDPLVGISGHNIANVWHRLNHLSETFNYIETFKIT